LTTASQGNRAGMAASELPVLGDTTWMPGHDTGFHDQRRALAALGKMGSYEVDEDGHLRRRVSEGETLEN
jgi:hypothetical protein